MIIHHDHVCIYPLLVVDVHSTIFFLGARFFFNFFLELTRRIDMMLDLAPSLRHQATARMYTWSFADGLASGLCCFCHINFVLAWLQKEFYFKVGGVTECKHDVTLFFFFKKIVLLFRTDNAKL